MTASKWIALVFFLVFFAVRLTTVARAQTCASPNPTCPVSLSCTASGCTFCAVNDTEFDSSESGTDCGTAPTIPSQFGTAQVADIGRQVSSKGTVQKRALLHFDLSRIPNGATISSATLHVCVESQTAAANFQVDLWRVTQPFWKETETIWRAYHCDTDGTGPDQALLWCTAGGDVTSANGVAWTTSGAGDRDITSASYPALVQLVQAAVKNNGGHLHMIAKANADDAGEQRLIRIRTHEYVANPPTLTVAWTAPAPGPAPAWVTFRDETSTRLPSSLATTDAEEKDIAVGDFDGDGHQDIIITRKLPFSAVGPRTPVLLMSEINPTSGNRILVDRTSTKLGDAAGAGALVPKNSRDVFVGDFSGDKAPDLVFANTCDEFPTFYQNKGGRCTVWNGFTRQDGWLPPPSPTPGAFSVPGKRFCAVTGGDVDKDGDVDLYFSNYTQHCDTEPTTAPASDKDVLLMNKIAGADATGRFIDESQPPVDRLDVCANVWFGTAVEIHDLRQSTTSNTVDIIKISTLNSVSPWKPNVLSNTDGTGVFILRNTGDAHFTWSGAFSAQDILDLNAPYMVTAGNLDNDLSGRLDFYVVDDQLDHVYIATGPTTYETRTVSAANSPRTQGLGGNVKTADIDGDGDLDVGVADVDVMIPPCPSDRSFTLLRNDGAGNLADPYSAAQLYNANVHDFAFVDLNGDGCLDVVLGLCTGYKVLINTTPPKCQGG
jgi:hypothetical protein